MRKHGWQLPYHPLQVVAVAVFLALGFAFYVFFAPFVGKRFYQYIVMAVYTPLIVCAISLYIWCAGVDPADSAVFKSKKYLKIPNNKKHTRVKESKLGGESTSSIQDAKALTGQKRTVNCTKDTDTRTEDTNTEIEKKNPSSQQLSCFMALAGLFRCVFLCNCTSPQEEFSEHKRIEDGMFYCSLCEVEVFKYSKHCRVCDKCVDRFDHHCRWLNNCVAKKNYRNFFILMVSALLLLILQWSTGIFVLIRCFLERTRFSVDITSKLGSGFTVVPFVMVVALCTILAMIATLPLVQLFFFHILLIKKGISTYDYIMAMREQEQVGVGSQQSPQMSPASSLTAISSASSFNTHNRGSWCTPPRLFFEDQFDVVPPETGSVSSLGKKIVGEETMKKKNTAAVRISPWTLARLNADDISKAAAEARKKSKILQPVTRRPDSTKKRGTKYGNNNGIEMMGEASNNLGPLQLEARSAFRSSKEMFSPESSLESPDLHPFRVSLGAEEATRQGIMPYVSTSDGYEASGGEDSDRVPSRTMQRHENWSDLPFMANYDEMVTRSLNNQNF